MDGRKSSVSILGGMTPPGMNNVSGSGADIWSEMLYNLMIFLKHCLPVWDMGGDELGHSGNRCFPGLQVRNMAAVWDP